MTSDEEELEQIKSDMKSIRKKIMDGVTPVEEKKLEAQIVVLQKRKLKLLRRK